MSEESKKGQSFKETTTKEVKRIEREELRKKIRSASPWLIVKSN